jgi:glycosyltransferase involved in cell wall biosynthesis
MQENKPFLSICIPTYNRFHKIKSMVENLLALKNNNFEIVILDNASTDKTEQYFSKITDIRLRYIRNKKNIGGIKNPIIALTYAKGVYCMLCLDKDSIIADKLEEFILFLMSNSFIRFGHCALNVKKEENNQVYNNLIQCFDKLAYQSSHPSGMFYLSNVYKNLNALKEILNSDKIFGFYFDLINAECSLNNAGAIYAKQLVITENLTAAVSYKSLTYTPENIFFLPENRINEFVTYLNQLKKFQLREKINKDISKRLFRRGLVSVTISYKKLRQDKYHCAHYGIFVRHVSVFEMIYFACKYCTAFFGTIEKKSFKNKILIWGAGLVIYYFCNKAIGLVFKT